MTQEEIIKKYEKFISNIEWHIKTNNPSPNALACIYVKLDCYKEILRDLSQFKLKGEEQTDAIDKAAENYICQLYYDANGHRGSFKAGVKWAQENKKAEEQTLQWTDQDLKSAFFNGGNFKTGVEWNFYLQSIKEKAPVE